jgi:hypothetical protein
MFDCFSEASQSHYAEPAPEPTKVAPLVGVWGKKSFVELFASSQPVPHDLVSPPKDAASDPSASASSSSSSSDFNTVADAEVRVPQVSFDGKYTSHNSEF